jgi:dTDP-4-dehydrorhamnose reductase
MKLLVTGGSGYLGATVLKRAPTTWEIAATFLTHRIAQNNVAAFHLDLRDANAVNRLFDELHPDVVIHTAAVMFGDDLISVNVDGSRNIARAAQRINASLIHMSTDVVFDGEHAPYKESDPVNPIHAYGKSKALAEQVVAEEYAQPIIVRTSLLYGFDPIDPRTQQILNGEMPRLFSDEYRCPILVDDLADALIEIATMSFRAEREISGHETAISPRQRTPRRNDRFFSIINLAGPQRLSRYEFGLKLAQAFGVDPRFESALSASHPAPRPRDCTLDISLAQKILKTRLHSVDEALAKR